MGYFVQLCNLEQLILSIVFLFPCQKPCTNYKHTCYKNRVLGQPGSSAPTSLSFQSISVYKIQFLPPNQHQILLQEKGNYIHFMRWGIPAIKPAPNKKKSVRKYNIKSIINNIIFSKCKFTSSYRLNWVKLCAKIVYHSEDRIFTPYWYVWLVLLISIEKRMPLNKLNNFICLIGKN